MRSRENAQNTRRARERDARRSFFLSVAALTLTIAARLPRLTTPPRGARGLSERARNETLFPRARSIGRSIPIARSQSSDKDDFFSSDNVLRELEDA